MDIASGPDDSLDESPPGWALIGFQKCSHCPPLKETEVQFCPFARVLAKPVEVLASWPTYQDVLATVLWRGREIRQNTTRQRALGSLRGLFGAISGCPHTRMLRAMAWFHWSFSNSTETLYRSLGTYLLGQHLRHEHGLEPDWSMNGLREMYRNLRLVNLGMAGRLRAAAQ